MKYFSVFTGYEIGCVSEERYKHFCETQEEFLNGMEILSSVEKTTNKWRIPLNLPPSSKNRVCS
jgi:tRNA U34 5-carboxymethylaminomethyl modifying enzyme MnmG/GidA